MSKDVKEFKFNSLEDCPNGVANLSKEGQKQWMEIANALLKAGDDKDFACRRAWQSIQDGWLKNEEGEWRPNYPSVLMPSTDKPMFSKEMSLADATKELEGVEVFEAGTWNGGKYTEKDLEEMVKNFGVLDAPLKIGHDAQQKLAGQPAVGWITKLYKKGKKLFADIKGVPKVVYELIKKGAYKKRSAELYFNVVDSTGKVLNNVFGGLALLGAELPAINTLGDIAALYGYEEGDHNKKVVMFEIKENEGGLEMEEEKEVVNEEVKEEIKEEIKEEVKEEIKEEPKEESKEEKKEEAPKDDVEQIKAENLQLKMDLEKERLQKEQSEIKEFMKSIEKKIPPVIAPLVFEALIKSDNTKKIEFNLKDDKKVEETNRGFLMKIFSDMPEMAILKNHTKTIESEEITKQHKAVMEANKLVAKGDVTFKDALIKVYELHPELVEQAKSISN